MASRVGFFLFFISIWIVIVAQSSFPDLVLNECRIKGITLVTPKVIRYSFNFTTAETVCLQLGLTLAYKVHMEEARKHGFETCSFGWVADGISVISRIQPNEKCGQSRTGVVEWPTPRSKPFHAYCFNSSDTWINSCKPDPILISTTGIAASSPAFQPETATARPTATATAKTTVKAKTSVKPGNDPQINLTNIPFPSTRAACLTTLIIKPTSPSYFLEKLTTTETKEETSAALENKGALKSDHVIFGGLPTALLVLALFFFAAAVTLAVCYVRKYKTTLSISNKTQQKENVEVKVFKETKTDKKSSDGEQKQNGQPTENPPSNSESKPAEPEKSVEAEV